MEKQLKSYKTELIIAVITGLTGIIIAAMSNWDKINKPTITTKTDTVRIYINPKQSDSNDIYFKDYHLLTQAADYANKMAKQGWEIESMKYSKTNSNTEDYVYLEAAGETLFQGMTYQIILFNDDPKKEFAIKLFPKDTTNKIETLNTRVEERLELDIKWDIKAISFQIPQEQVDTRYTYLVISKKT